MQTAGGDCMWHEAGVKYACVMCFANEEKMRVCTPNNQALGARGGATSRRLVTE